MNALHTLRTITAVAAIAGGLSAACGSVTPPAGARDDASVSGDAAAPDAPAASGTPVISIAPAAQDFGSVPTGTTSTPVTFTVRNGGTGPTGLLQLNLTGSVFAVANDSCSSSAVMPGAACRFDISYLPRGLTNDVGTAEVSGPSGLDASARLVGVGISPDGLLLTPSLHDFGPFVVGSPRPTQRFTLANHATVTTGVLAIALSGASAGDLSVTHDCTRLTAGASCSIDVTLVGTSAGSKTAGLDVSATPGGALSAPLSAVVQTPAAVTLSATSTTGFGDVVVGGTSDRAFVVSNSGTQPTGPLAISLTGADYSLQSGVVGDCMSGTTTLQSGAVCNVRVRLQPTATGSRTATLAVSATPGGSQSLGLTGNGLAPGQLSGDISSHNFGIVEVGVVSGAVGWTITNTGGVATGMLALSSGNTREVAITGNTCTQPLSPSASCMITATLAPSGGGARSGNLSVTATPGGSAGLSLAADGRWRITVTRTGTGTVTAPGISCGSDCTDLYANNSVVALHAATTNGSSSHFSSWGGDCFGGVVDCTLTMTGPRTATAAFAATTTNLAFVSSATYPSNLGGVAAYDSVCNALATSAGINSAAGTAFKAWISDSTSNAALRIGAGTGGWRRLDDRIFARSMTDLVNGRLFYPLAITELGATLQVADVWTATHDDGTVRSGHCANWTDPAGTADNGQTLGGPGLWTVWQANGCAGNRHVFCLQSSSATALPVQALPAGAKVVYYALGFTPGGGIAAANAFCNANKPSGLSARTFRALLATSTQPAGNLVTGAATYFRPDGVFVGTGSDLQLGNQKTGIWAHFDGTYPGGLVSAWSGSTAPGTLGSVATTCNDWTAGDAASTGRQGFVNRWDGTQWWSSGGAVACNASHGLYCVEP